jgi:hypothetical protein
MLTKCSFWAFSGILKIPRGMKRLEEIEATFYDFYILQNSLDPQSPKACASYLPENRVAEGKNLKRATT